MKADLKAPKAAVKVAAKAERRQKRPMRPVHRLLLGRAALLKHRAELAQGFAANAKAMIGLFALGNARNALKDNARNVLKDSAPKAAARAQTNNDFSKADLTWFWKNALGCPNI